jgi:hypothetical protein
VFTSYTKIKLQQFNSKKQIQSLFLPSKKVLMHPILKNILAVIAGLVIGGLVNQLIVTIGTKIIPLPNGAVVATLESLKAAMHLFTPINFLMPFSAHALGTLVGAFVTAKFAFSRNFKLAMLIGAFQFIGGWMMIMMLPSPTWFTVLDLGIAYLPMAYLGWKIVGNKKASTY